MIATALVVSSACTGSDGESGTSAVTEVRPDSALGDPVNGPSTTTWADQDSGFEISYPATWYVAGHDLTPGAGLMYRLAVASYPLPAGGGGGCGHLPIAALNRMSPTDAFIHLEERGPVSATADGFGERPDSFASLLDGIDEATDAWECIASEQRDDIGVLRWIDFRDHGRGFYLLVAIGAEASTDDLAVASRVLDSLVISEPTEDQAFTELGAPGCQPPSPFKPWGNADVDDPDQGLVEIRATATTIEVWGLLWATPPLPVSEEIKMVWRVTGSGRFHARATGKSGEIGMTWGPNEHSGSNFARPGQEWGTAFVFPEAGCWTIEITRGDDIAQVWVEAAA